MRTPQKFIVVVALVGAGYFLLRREKPEAPRDNPGPEAPVRPAAASTTQAAPAQFAELQRLRSSDPEAALQLCDKLAAQPEITAIHAELLETCFTLRLRAGRADDALALRARLKQFHPDARQNREVQVRWEEHLTAAATRALQAGDAAATEAAMLGLLAEPNVSNSTQNVFAHWQAEKLKPYREALQQKATPAPAYLTEAARIIGGLSFHNFQSVFGGAVLPGEQILKMGDEVATGESPHAALVFWDAAAERLRGGRWFADVRARLDPKQREALEAEVRQKLFNGWIALAEKLRRGDRPRFVAISAAEACDGAAFAVQNRPEQADAYRAKVAIETDDVRPKIRAVLAMPLAKLAPRAGLGADGNERLKAQVADARSELSRVFQSSARSLLDARVRNLEFDPWPLVPAALRAQAEKSEPGGPSKDVELRRRFQILAHYGARPTENPLPELAPLRELQYQVNARGGLVEFKGTDGAEMALDQLRTALRGTQDARLRDDIAAALKKRLAEAGDAGDFEQFYLLAGFYPAEVGLPSKGDAFREKFRGWLVKAAKEFERQEVVKRIFLLTLLNEFFADEPVGRDAGKEAFVLAFRQAESMSVATDAQSARPSGLPQWSAHVIDNSTSFHLLGFYRGPEQFVVHNWPYRRGTAVMANGTYELVVLCPDGGVRPYRGKIEMQSGVRASDYHVQSQSRGPGGTTFTPQTGAAWGNYTLLRGPPGEAGLAVAAQSGMVIAK